MDAKGQVSDSLSYERVASFYDLLAQGYSLGAINRAKRVHLQHVSEGDRILYLGAGTAAEAVDAARRGADVTVVDRSPKMCAIARVRFERSGQRGLVLRQDAFASIPGAPFDHVVLPFFLNVFAPLRLPKAALELLQHLEVGGLLSISDFRAPHSSLTLRALQKLYYLPALVLFAVLVRNPWHPLYDYERDARLAALPLALKTRAFPAVLGIPLYESCTYELTAPLPSGEQPR